MQAREQLAGGSAVQRGPHSQPMPTTSSVGRCHRRSRLVKPCSGAGAGLQSGARLRSSWLGA